MNRQTHTATVTPMGDGQYLVSCSHGCNLGTSAHAGNLQEAEKRVSLHELCTAPLTSSGIDTNK